MLQFSSNFEGDKGYVLHITVTFGSEGNMCTFLLKYSICVVWKACI